jgi:hypothetical protein
VAAYHPETNVLVPLRSVAAMSNQPAISIVSSAALFRSFRTFSQLWGRNSRFNCGALPDFTERNNGFKHRLEHP